MFVIAEYRIAKKGDYLRIENKTGDVYCPECGMKLHYRDTRKRIRKSEGGSADWLLVRRMKCSNCNRLHVELPTCVVPYKHYATEIISGVIDNVVTTSDLESENYPAEITMIRWKQWFENSEEKMEEYLQSSQLVECSVFPSEFKSDKALIAFRNHFSDWLERIMFGVYGCNKDGQYCLWL